MSKKRKNCDITDEITSDFKNISFEEQLNNIKNEEIINIDLKKCIKIPRFNLDGYTSDNEDLLQEINRKKRRIDNDCDFIDIKKKLDKIEKQLFIQKIINQELNEKLNETLLITKMLSELFEIDIPAYKEYIKNKKKNIASYIS